VDERDRFVIATFFEAIMTVLYTYAIFARYCMPYFQEMDGDYKSLILGIFKVMMPGTVHNCSSSPTSHTRRVLTCQL
jgi:hypothetical protein